MTEEDKRKWDEVRDKCLREQRDCAWCGHKAETSNGLVRHILENHHEKELTETEKGLLAELQEEDAQ